MARTPSLKRSPFDNVRNGSLAEISTPIPAAEAAKQLVYKARQISTWDSSSTADLKSFIRNTAAFGKKGDRVALVLIDQEGASEKEQWEKSIWASKMALDLLLWLLTNFKEAFDRKPDNKGQKESDISDRLALHFAIERKNLGFLVCLFSLPRETLDRFKSIFENEEKEGKNAVHLALQTGLPFASAFVAVCSAKALSKVDDEGYTPIHRGMRREDAPETWVPSLSSASKRSDSSVVLSRRFLGRELLEELKQRKDAADILPKVLTAVAQKGSLYQGLAKVDSSFEDQEKAKADPDVKEIKQLIFRYLKSIPDATTALYGNSPQAKELCLDMSDFNRSSHDFEKFVDRLTTIVPRNMNDDSDDEEDTAVSLPGMVSFEDTLFFVQLPDLNHVKQPCYQETIRKLFSWLAKTQGVKTIKRLYIPDSSLTPLSDAFIALYVLDQFNIEALDWRKLDVNLEVFTSSSAGRRTEAEVAVNWNTCKHLRELTLHSSGNWSVLYHWISEDGLARLPELNKVVIEIVHLNPTNNKGVRDENTRKYHRSMVARYKDDLYTIHRKKQQLYREESEASSPNYRYKLEIRLDSRWDYPHTFQETEEPTMSVPRHRFTSLLGPCKSFIDERVAQAANVRRVMFPEDKEKRNNFLGKDELHRLSEQDKVANKLYERVLLADPDKRIKVAVIDNGADKIRSPIGPWIDKGVSYVSSDRLGEAPRPWWMVADAHGTQMASLINNVNPYCRLYIARVGKGRADIDPKKAAKAILWAVEQQVDIISMSWVTKSSETELKNAVEEAAAKSSTSNRRPTLMFCSTADEGAFAGDVYPVDYTDFVVSVTATDTWGGLTSKSDRQKPVDIRIPGEDLEASAPLYLGNVPTSVSGSSVATALAAGIASLALLLLRTYNNVDEKDMWPFYTRVGIMRVFNRMNADKGALQIQNLFPRDPVDPSSLDAAVMASKWDIKNFSDSSVFLHRGGGSAGWP
ncbi:S8 family peptidase [Aspergillus undulatus]|uniref:S8 family peptidase n=1 Tax=Aspergillus undulatus TaxID=1810928 RepID=UPI003CCD53FE